MDHAVRRLPAVGTITVRYHRVLDPSNPADLGKVRDYDSFTLRRRRSDGESEQEDQRRRSAVVR